MRSMHSYLRTRFRFSKTVHLRHDGQLLYNIVSYFVVIIDVCIRSVNIFARKRSSGGVRVCSSHCSSLFLLALCVRAARNDFAVIWY